MSRFVVTGGAGFIGSHLVERLDEDGASIVVIDDLSAGYEANLKGRSQRVELQIARVEDVDFERLGRIDAVFHLAAQASVPLSISDPYGSSSRNLLSTLKVIDHCSKAQIPLVYASSSAVYGNLPVGAEDAGIDLLSPYAADKYVAEIYCAVAHRLYALRSFGLRFFNVYGPRQDPKNPYSGVISIFADRMLRGQPITINGGYQTRDFIYVGDVVRGILRAYEVLRVESIAAVSNLLTGKSTSIEDLVSALSKILNVEPQRQYRPLPPGDPEASSGDVGHMRRMLGLELERFTSFEEGLARTVEWMRESIEKG